LHKEELQPDDPEWFLGGYETEKPPLRQRNSLIKHISLRAKWDLYPENGIREQTTLGMFQPSSTFFPNLKSIRTDGVLSQRVWDTLVKLPSIQELRLWRVDKSSEPLSNFQGLSRLQALEIVMLSPGEALPLGNAVRQSALERLHITDVDMGLPYFFAILIKGPTDLKERPENTEDASYGFPPSLVELAIESDSNR
jgi:hypothetical protein